MLRLESLRIERNIDQKVLSLDLRVSQPTISDWENGKKTPSVRNLIKIATYFGVSIDYLLGLTEDKSTLGNESGLSEAEETMLKLFRLVPAKDQGMVIQMIEAALRSRGLL